MANELLEWLHVKYLHNVHRWLPIQMGGLETIPSTSFSCMYLNYCTLTTQYMQACVSELRRWLGQPHLCFLCRNKLPAQSGLRCRPLLHLAGNPSSLSASASCLAHTHSVRNRTEREGWMMVYDRGRLTTSKSLSIFLNTDVRNFTRNCLRVQVCIYCPYWDKCDPTLPNYSCHIHVRKCDTISEVILTQTITSKWDF